MGGKFGHSYRRGKPINAGSRKQKHTTRSSNPRKGKDPVIRVVVPGFGEWELTQVAYRDLEAQAAKHRISIGELLKRRLDGKGL